MYNESESEDGEKKRWGRAKVMIPSIATASKRIDEMEREKELNR